MKSKKDEPVFDFDKSSKIYKFFDIFFDDDQKQSLAITSVVNFLWVAYHIPIARKSIRKEIFEEGQLIRCTTDENICFVGFNLAGCKADIIYKPRGTLFGKWQEIELPADLAKLISPEMEKAKFKKALSVIMNMKVFW